MSVRRCVCFVGYGSLSVSLTLGCASLLNVDDLRFDRAGGAGGAGGLGAGGRMFETGGADQEPCSSCAAGQPMGEDGGASDRHPGSSGGGAEGGSISLGGAGDGGACVDSDCGRVCARPASVCDDCVEQACGRIPWRSVPYTIVSSANGVAFDSADVGRIRAAITAWSASVQFHDCGAVCADGRALQIEPGITFKVGAPVAAGVQHLSLLPGEPLYRYAHDLGHALGFPDTINRADRDLDRLASVYTEICAQGASAQRLWKCGSPPSLTPSAPRIPTGQFGPYPAAGESIMDAGAHADCSSSTAWTGPALPTSQDLANALELTVVNFWSPFTPLVSAPSAVVDTESEGEPVGTPSLCSAGYPALTVFVRGANDKLYRSDKLVSSGLFQGWSAWSELGSDVASDPACVAVGGGELALATSNASGNVQLRIEGQGTSSNWVSLGAPASGLGSGPALATRSVSNRAVLDVFVLGADGGLYQRTYQDVASPGVWQRRVDGHQFAGKPSATGYRSTQLAVALRGLDDTLELVELDGTTEATTNIQALLLGDPAIVSRGDDGLDVFMRGLDSSLWQWARGGEPGLFRLGGQLSSSPAAVVSGDGHPDIAALLGSHGSRSLWWKFGNYRHPCSDAGACVTCAE